ncbi:MAG: glycoside hydrolase TIM-barrel-like domain-containing protein [candidate division WOR-3 bacterium]
MYVPILFCSLAGWQVRGVNYVSWQTGTYPYSTAWQYQKYWNSQGIDSIWIGTHQGRNALGMRVYLNPDDSTRRSGEVYVDVRYFPPQCSAPGHGQNDTLVPVDLRGESLNCYVWCPRGTRGRPDAPNGLQVFVKDSSWRSWYSPWQNIVLESAWNRVSALIPDTSGAVDLSHIVCVGFKFGLNANAVASVRCTMWLDDYNWGNSRYIEYPFEHLGNALDSLVATGCSHVALVNTWYMRHFDDDSIFPDSTRTHSDSELAAFFQQAGLRNLSVMVKPHVDVYGDSWRGYIYPRNPSNWFRCYRRFILHHAHLAQSSPAVKWFCIGTELAALDTGFRQQWHEIIDSLRQILPTCTLTYAANWSPHPLRVCFWNRLDVAGIDAYFPLRTGSPDPPLAAIISGWQAWKRDSIYLIHQQTGKPIVFTEAGYPSRYWAADSPWVSTPCAIIGTNCELQARCYEALCQVWDTTHWFLGTFWWHWMPVVDAGGLWDDHYTPQNKPARDHLFPWTTGFWKRSSSPIGHSQSATCYRLTGRPAEKLDIDGADAMIFDVTGRMAGLFPAGVYFILGDGNQCGGTPYQKIVILK